MFPSTASDSQFTKLLQLARVLQEARVMESELHKEGDDLEIWLSFHPVEAFVAVPYEGVWFWIARNDLASRTTLAAVTMLFNFLEGGDKAAPLLTIPTY